MKRVRKFLSHIITAIIIATAPAMAIGATNLPMGDVDQFGTWATEHNREMFTKSITGDITEFQSQFQKQVVKDYVPIEAKIGLALMNGFSLVGDVLNSSLVRFVIMFIIIAYAFWIAFEAYNIIIGKSDYKKQTIEILKKGGIIAIWLFVLDYGVVQIFTWAVWPIIQIGSMVSNMILDAVAQTVGLQLPDTCAAIHTYTAAHTSQSMLIDANAAADLMCVPTRLSGFFYTAVALGWKWIIAGIGHSAFAVIMGAIFIIVFLINIWKFALMALGVIVDLFLAVLMLPFTAIAETVSNTSYKGIAGDIFNGFAGMFKTQSLENRVMQFVNAAIYFVSLSVVVSVCAGILSGAVNVDAGAAIPSLENDGYIMTLLTGLLVAHLASKAADIAKDLGGKIDQSFGTQFGKDIQTLSKNAFDKIKSTWKTIRENSKD